MHKEIIVTIDIGSSKIIAAAGEKNEKGAVHILEIATEATNAAVRKGRIFNVEEVSGKIRMLLNRLNEKLNDKITKVYVGVGGRSLMTETHSVVEETDGAVINEQMLQSLREKCEAYQPDLLEVLEIGSPEYFLDGKPEKHPIGVFCEKIEAQFTLILGNPSIKRNLNTCISEKNEIEIAGYFIAPVATATATLTEQEKNLGCALIEFGAGITYLSVYKNNLLKYLVAIPIGGSTITKDICDMKVSEEEAEKLKIKYGNALIDIDKEEDFPTKVMINGQEINIEKFNNIVEARAIEIVANVKNQLEISGFSNSLESGIIITGGAAALKNLTECIKEEIKQDVRIATVKSELIDKDSVEYKHIPGIEETIGLLSLCAENYVKASKVIEVIETPVNSHIQTEATDIFGNPIQKKPEKTGKRKMPEIKKVEEIKEDDNETKDKKGEETKRRISIFFDKMSKKLFDDTDAITDDTNDENKSR